MKIVFFVILIAIFGMATAVLTKEMKKQMMAHKMECIEATPGFDISLIAKAKAGEYPDKEKLGAFLKCMAEKLKFLKADGSYNIVEINEKISKKLDIDVSDIVDKCTKKDEKDAVKNALQLAKCLCDNLPKHDGAF